MVSQAQPVERVDIAIIGAGAAGLMAGIWAGRSNPQRSIVILDSAARVGRKILVAGGGRCNVTHHTVSADDYAGSTPPAIRKVLQRFDVADTIAFFHELGVTLKQEPTGKLFPTTDRAQTVLEALLAAVQATGVVIRHPRRVATLARAGDFWHLGGDWGALAARSVVLATGGRSLPQSGSDGHGFRLAQDLGHSLTPHITPALTPLTLPADHFLCQLRGVSAPASLSLWSGQGRRLISFTDAVLCAHFGLSGPAILNISRHYLYAVADDPAAYLTINWLPMWSEAQLEAALQTAAQTGATPLSWLRAHLPERLARTLCAEAGALTIQLTREQRRRLAQLVTRCPLPITGHRGWAYAEATAGGVPLRELDLKTMQSRRCAGLFLCGEICDVDGRIGGFNFQWAWASGYVAGVSV